MLLDGESLSMCRMWNGGETETERQPDACPTLVCRDADGRIRSVYLISVA
jgi:hypothetical protein